MNKDVNTALEAILLVTRNMHGSPGMGTIADLTEYVAAAIDEPPPAAATSDEVLSYQFMLVMNYLKAHQLIRPGTFSEQVIHALDQADKIKEAVASLEDRCKTLEAEQPTDALNRRNKRIVELETALKPFALIGAAIGLEWADNRRMSSLNTTVGNLSVGEFHAAAKALGILQPMPVTPQTAAATSPGPVNCNIRIQHAEPDRKRPRTCDRCGLGPCLFFNNDGSAIGGH